jgi:hypothetical protein
VLPTAFLIPVFNLNPVTFLPEIVPSIPASQNILVLCEWNYPELGVMDTFLLLPLPLNPSISKSQF